jgi:hypothetical protein
MNGRGTAPKRVPRDDPRSIATFWEEAIERLKRFLEDGDCSESKTGTG